MQKMPYHSKEFFESIFLYLVNVQKTDGTNKCYFAQKKVVLFNYIFYQNNCSVVNCMSGKLLFPGKSPLTPYIIIKNTHTLFARSIFRQQVHHALISSVRNNYEKLFQV